MVYKGVVGRDSLKTEWANQVATKMPAPAIQRMLSSQRTEVITSWVLVEGSDAETSLSSE